MHCGPCLELLGFCPSFGPFNGVQLKWLLSFAVISTATSRFWRSHLWPHVLLFLPANVSPVTPELISSLWPALRPQGRFRVHVLLLEYVSTFLLRLVPTLVSLVSFVRSLSALFSSSRFVASLVSLGYLSCYFCHYLAIVFLLSRPFCLFIASLRIWNWLISAMVSNPPICVLSYGRCSFACFFLVLLFFKGRFALLNSERRKLRRGRVSFAKLLLSGPRSLQSSRRPTFHGCGCQFHCCKATKEPMSATGVFSLFFFEKYLSFIKQLSLNRTQLWRCRLSLRTAIRQKEGGWIWQLKLRPRWTLIGNRPRSISTKKTHCYGDRSM